MVYDFQKHRYILTPQFVRDRGIDLDIVLNKDLFPDPQVAIEVVLDRISLLVYANIYNYGRQKRYKEFLLACHPDIRDIVKEAMFERLNYVTTNEDLSVKSGALVSQGVRIETQDLVPSLIEEMLLRPTGLLHRGEYDFMIDESLNY